MKTATKEKIYTQHAENTEWVNKLQFYKDEIVILKKRLEELSSKNNQKDVLKEVEHFQNQFIVQRNNIDEIMHLVRVNEDGLQNEIKNNPIAVERRSSEYHAKEKDLVEGFEKNFNNLRKEFNTFSAKWM